MDDEISDIESENYEMEDINVLHVFKDIHASLTNIQELRGTYDIALDQLNNLDSKEKNINTESDFHDSRYKRESSTCKNVLAFVDPGVCLEDFSKSLKTFIYLKETSDK